MALKSQPSPLLKPPKISNNHVLVKVRTLLVIAGGYTFEDTFGCMTKRVPPHVKGVPTVVNGAWSTANTALSMPSRRLSNR